MVDPNTDQKMGESDDIINYLYNNYGDGNIPLLLKLGPLTAISNSLALLPRFCSRLHCRPIVEVLPGYQRLGRSAAIAIDNYCIICKGLRCRDEKVALQVTDLWVEF